MSIARGPLDEADDLCRRLVELGVMLNYNLRISISRRGQVVWLLVQGDQLATVNGVLKKLTVAKLCKPDGQPVESRVPATTTLAAAIDQAASEVVTQIRLNFKL